MRIMQNLFYIPCSSSSSFSSFSFCVFLLFPCAPSTAMICYAIIFISHLLLPPITPPPTPISHTHNNHWNCTFAIINGFIIYFYMIFRLWCFSPVSINTLNISTLKWGWFVQNGGNFLILDPIHFLSYVLGSFLVREQNIKKGSIDIE